MSKCQKCDPLSRNSVENAYPRAENKGRTVQNATPSSEIASVGVGEVHLSADGDFEQQAL